MRKSDKSLDVLKRLQNRVETVEFQLKRLLLNREFDNNEIIEYLKTQPFPAIIPLTIRGKNGGTRALLKGSKSYTTSYTRRSKTYSTKLSTLVWLANTLKVVTNVMAFLPFCLCCDRQLKTLPQPNLSRVSFSLWH